MLQLLAKNCRLTIYLPLMTVVDIFVWHAELEGIAITVRGALNTSSLGKAICSLLYLFTISQL
jgi:hypothetical protein